MFWETLPGAIASWGLAITTLLFLAKKGWDGLRVGNKLIDIGSKDEWPNGAHSLPEAMTEIYDRQGETHDAVKILSHRLESYIVAHRADHGLPPPDDPIGTPDGF